MNNHDNLIRKQTLTKVLKYHRRKFEDGESDCIEVYNKNFEIISDVYEIDEKGNEKVIPKEIAQKQQQEEQCHFCEFIKQKIKDVSK